MEVLNQMPILFKKYRNFHSGQSDTLKLADPVEETWVSKVKVPLKSLGVILYFWLVLVFLAQKRHSVDYKWPNILCGSRCCCGRTYTQHKFLVDTNSMPAGEIWYPSRCTVANPTDAYGTLEFQGGPHPSKAQVSDSIRIVEHDFDVGNPENPQIQKVS